MVKDIHFPSKNQTKPQSSSMIFPPCSKKPKGQRVVHRNFWISWGKWPFIVSFPMQHRDFPMNNGDFPMKHGDFALPPTMTCTSFHATPICWNKSSIRWSPSTTSFPAPLATSWCRVNGDSIYLPSSGWFIWMIHGIFVGECLGPFVSGGQKLFLKPDVQKLCLKSTLNCETNWKLCLKQTEFTKTIS